MLAERAGDRAGARASYDTAVRLADAGRDPTTGAEANRLRGRLPR
jgi:hypothetical protein